MGQFLGTSKPSIIMNCNCICTVFFPSDCISIYTIYLYNEIQCQAFLCRGSPPPRPPNNLVLWVFASRLSRDDRKDLNKT